MKIYEDLTRLGRLRRLRELACEALKLYGFTGAVLKYMHSEGNVIFRVELPGSINIRTSNSPYIPNHYNLRILSTNNIEGVLGELTWLAALRRDADLPVPEPVPTLNGDLITRVVTPGVPQGKLVSLMRWVDGKHIGAGLKPRHARAWGALVAHLHSFSAGWTPPGGFERPTWDWDGQLGNAVLRTPVPELVETMPMKFQQPFKTISEQIREIMDSFGKGPDAYGLVHCDMYLENLLFKRGLPRLIDFEDCGFSYWMWDIGVIFSQWPWTDEFPRLRDAFFDGYLLNRTLPESQLKHLDSFMAAHCATMVLWSTMFIKNDPALKTEYEVWRNKEGAKLLRYFERI